MDEEKADKFVRKELSRGTISRVDQKSLIQGKSQGGQIYDLD